MRRAIDASIGAAGNAQRGRLLRQGSDLLRGSGLAWTHWPTMQVALGGHSRREYKAPVSSVKKGSVIEHLGKLWEVVETSQSHKTAQRRAHITMELRDLGAGTKKNERFRVEDRLEVITLDVRKCTYLRSEGKKLLFTAEETGDEITVRKDLVGVVEYYLKPGTSKATIAIHDGDAVTIRLPRKALAVVKEADITQSAASGYKKVLLDNGRHIRAPPHVNVGDAIVVIPEKEEYLGKSSETALDEDEEEEEEEEDDDDDREEDEEDDQAKK